MRSLSVRSYHLIILIIIIIINANLDMKGSIAFIPLARLLQSFNPSMRLEDGVHSAQSRPDLDLHHPYSMAHGLKVETRN